MIIPTVAGYYWLKNSPYDDHPQQYIYRPVEIIIFPQSTMYGGKWISAGTYVLLIGDSIYHHITYFSDSVFKNVEFIKMETPTS